MKGSVIHYHVLYTFTSPWSLSKWFSDDYQPTTRVLSSQGCEYLPWFRDLDLIIPYPRLVLAPQVTWSHCGSREDNVPWPQCPYSLVRPGVKNSSDHTLYQTIVVSVDNPPSTWKEVWFTFTFSICSLPHEASSNGLVMIVVMTTRFWSSQILCTCISLEI